MGEGGAACARLRAAGLRLTEPRRRLVELFAGLGRWCTPQELHAEACRAGIHAGIATVYRLVELLLELGLCRAYPQRDHSVRYVFCAAGHHHHFICEDCGAVTEIAECQVQAPADFAVREHAVDFFGRCDGCVPANKAALAARASR